MAYGDARQEVDAWVYYDPRSGTVLKIQVGRPPHWAPQKGEAVLQTRLSLRAVDRAHELKVIHGRVSHTPSLGGV